MPAEIEERVGGRDVSRSAPSSFLGIQALRGIAALMVVAFHATQTWSQHVSGGTSPWMQGELGVDIFFVISGLVMAVSTIGREHKSHPAASFIKRRLIRLVPLYWIVTLLVLAKLTFVRGHQQFANSQQLVDTPWQYILASLTFFPYRNSLGFVQPILSVGWTLSFEMFFYLLFALALALRVRVASMLAPIMILLAVAGHWRTADWPAFTMLASPSLLEFLAGLLLGQAILSGVRIPRVAAALLCGTGILLLLWFPTLSHFMPEFTARAIPAALLVSGVTWIEPWTGASIPRWSLLIGDSSYSIYLVHLVVFSFLVKLFTKMHLLIAGLVRWRDEALVVAMCLCFAIIIGGLLYSLVERPLTRFLRKRVAREPRPVVE